MVEGGRKEDAAICVSAPFTSTSAPLSRHLLDTQIYEQAKDWKAVLLTRSQFHIGRWNEADSTLSLNSLPPTGIARIDNGQRIAFAE